ncbi:MAG: OmpA family protein [Fibrobacteraceae bacterium]|nr:OmpA family protein [Fibrobacteraceae bacterium]
MKEREAHANAKQDSLLKASKEREATLLAQASAREDSLLRASKERESELEKALAEERAKAEARQKEAKSKLNELQSKLIQVTQDARGIILSMSDILFDVNKASLKQDLKTSLAKVAGILSVYQELNVLVEGHTDNTGSEKHNMKLSEQRAKNVMDFLVSQGIDVSRLTSKGYGMTRPVGDNKTKDGRQKNRRVDLVIQDKVLLGK